MINPFKDINWNPDVAAKRKFAASLIYGLPVIALVLSLVHHHRYHESSPGLIRLGAGGMVLGALLWLVPQIARPFYLACYFFAACMGFVVGNLIFSLFFYLMFTPLGLALRLANPKGFPKRPDKTRASYWQPAKKVTDPQSYYRQF